MVHLDLKIQSCPDFPAETRQEMLSCPVLSRGFQKFECLDLSWNQISDYLKVLTCLDMHLCCLALSWIHIFVSVSCLVLSRKVFKIFCLSRLVSSREFPVPTHPCFNKLCNYQFPGKIVTCLPSRSFLLGNLQYWFTSRVKKYITNVELIENVKTLMTIKRRLFITRLRYLI